MKTLKHAIADRVFELVEREQFAEMDDIVSAEVMPVANLERQLRVKTRNGGTHYINIKVSESW